MAAKPQSALDTSGRMTEIESDVAGLRADVRNLGLGLARVENALVGIAGKVEIGSRTNWGWVIAACGFVTTVLGGLIVLGSRGPLSDLDGLKEESREAHGRALDEAEVRGRQAVLLELLTRYAIPPSASQPTAPAPIKAGP